MQGSGGRREGCPGVEFAGEHSGERAERDRSERFRGRDPDHSIGVGLSTLHRDREQTRLADAALADEHGADALALDLGQLRIPPDERPTALGGVPAHGSRVGALLHRLKDGPGGAGARARRK